MSTIYISEPPTSGKVVINTSCGEVEIELWSKEAPIACRSFVQLCMEGYYDNTIFHRVVKKFILQGGDPTGTGNGGESSYGKPYKMEIHSRLRFNRRGLVAMHCENGEVNGSQFFFTLNKTAELQNNYTIFGTVVGDTVFNMLTLAEGIIDKETERPHDPQRILSTTIIVNPFDDIIPRESKSKEPPRLDVPAVDDVGLLSFMGDFDDDEENNFETNFRSKTKSAHDYAKNSNLSNETVQIDPNETTVFRSADIDRAPALITKSEESREKREEIRRMKEENRRLQKELVTELLKDRANEKNEIVSENEDNEKNAATTSDNGSGSGTDPLTMLKNFSDKLKHSSKSDWFFTAVTGTDNDAIETKVYDPEVYNPEKYDLFDPRNPLNQRKRQMDEHGHVHDGNKKAKEKK